MACKLARNLFFLITVCFSVDIGCSQPRQKPVLRMIALVEKFSTSEELDPYKIAEVAVEIINNSSDILPEHELQLVRCESGCANPLGLVPYQAANVLLKTADEENPAFVGIIGSTCSSSALFLGSLIGRNVPLINIHLAASSLLENHSKYPNSFGIVGSSSLLLHSTIELIRRNRWSYVNILYDESQLYHTSALRNLDHSLFHNFTVKEYFVSAIHFTYIPLSEIKHKSRIMFLFMREELARKVMCLAYHSGLLFPAYQFVLADIDITTFVGSITFIDHNRRSYDCSAHELAVSLLGTIYVNFHVNTISSYHSRTDYNSYYKYFMNRLEERVGTHTNLTQELNQLFALNPVVSYYLDALMSFVLAFNSSQLEQRDLCYNTTCVNTIKRNILKLDFGGFSGQVRFSNSTSFVDRNVSVHQYTEEGRFVLLATYDHFGGRMLEISKGSFLPWKIRMKNITVYSRGVPEPFAYITFIITSVVLLLVIILHTLTVLFRNAKPVKASSFKLLQLAFAGSYILVVGIAAYTSLEAFVAKYDVQAGCYLWHVVNTSQTMGYTMITSTLCVRTWRLYRIFVFYKNPGRFLADYVLILTAFACVLVVVLVALLWFVIDPLRPTLLSTRRELNIIQSLNRSIVDVEMLQYTSMGCRVKFSFLFWFFFLNAFCYSLLLVLFVLVFLTRSVPQKDFKTLNVMRLNYVFVGSGFLVLSIYMVLLYSSSPAAILIRFILFTVLLNAINVSVCTLLYSPPLYSVLRAKQ